MTAPLPICLSAGNLVPRHVKRITLDFVPLDLVCDVVKLFEHVEELNCQRIEAAQQVRLWSWSKPLTLHCIHSFSGITAYILALEVQ